MMLALTRRSLFAAAAGALAAPLFPALRSLAMDAPTLLRLEPREIEVQGRPAAVFGIRQPNGTVGFAAEAGQAFRVRLENGLDEPALIHWHGLTPPWRQDGAGGVSQAPLPPDGRHDYDFPLDRPGTHWMHAHHGLRQQQLLAAPLIVRDPAERGLDEQEVVVMLHDFTFRPPEEILSELLGGGGAHARHAAPAAGGDGIDHAAMGHVPAATAPAPAHLNDIEFDAYLANDRTLDDPEVVRVERRGRVRLRLVNASAATNFVVDLGERDGTLFAVDGVPVRPVVGRRFALAMAQRLDIRLELPPGDGATPVLALREGDRARTGIVLATPRGEIRRLGSLADAPAEAVGLELEARLRAVEPLPDRPADEVFAVDLTGGEADYVWSLDGRVYGEHRPLRVSAGQRSEIAMTNRTTMAHPMHLHGHRFQVVEIDGQRLAGAVRDTVLVPAGGRVTIAFDADNPGLWPFHCHHLYHMEAGMMTVVEYDRFT